MKVDSDRIGRGMVIGRSEWELSDRRPQSSTEVARLCSRPDPRLGQKQIPLEMPNLVAERLNRPDKRQAIWVFAHAGPLPAQAEDVVDCLETALNLIKLNWEIHPQRIH